MAGIDVVSAGTAGLLAAGGASVAVQLIQAWRHRGKDRGEEEAVIVGTARELVAMLREELHQQEERHRTEMDRLSAEHRTEMDRLHVELETARSEIAQLKDDLATAGGRRPPPD